MDRHTQDAANKISTGTGGAAVMALLRFLLLGIAVVGSIALVVLLVANASGIGFYFTAGLLGVPVLLWYIFV